MKNTIKPNFTYLSSKKVTNVDTTESYEELFDFLEKNKLVGLDTENTGLDPHTSKNVFLQIGNKEKQFVIDINSKECFDLNVNRLKSWFFKDVTFVIHNLKYDLKFLKKLFNFTRDEITILIKQKKFQDTYIAEKVYTNSDDYNPANLAFLVSKYCKANIFKSERENFSQQNFHINYNLIEYSAIDVIYLVDIYNELYKKLEENYLLFIYNLELAAAYVYSELEYQGMPFNKVAWEEIESNNKLKLIELEQSLADLIKQRISTEQNKIKKGQFKECIKSCRNVDIFTNKAVGTDLDLNLKSPKDKLFLLETCLELDVKIKNKTKTDDSDPDEKDSSGSEVLEKYLDIPEVKVVYDWASISKEITGFGSNFFKYINPITKRIHANFNQLGTVTGRVSCNDPNLQNIPKDVKFRHCFDPQNENRSVITADYSGCELCILAELTREPLFIESINNHKDLHSLVASMVFKVPVSKTENKHLRDVAKQINFGLSYGAEADKLSQVTGKSVEECKVIIKTYFKMFPKIKQYLDRVSNDAVNFGECKTILGRRKLIYVDKDNFKDVARAKRQAKNMPIQGANADLLKLAMIYIYKELNTVDITANIIHNVHDEIVVECSKNKEKEIALLMKENMLKASKLISEVVNFDVEVTIEKYWTK